jgi:hypothetical protein
MKTRKQVIEWIVSQDWCDEFIANATTAEQREITTDKKVLLDIVIPIDISLERMIDKAFWWNQTREGSDYWFNIDRVYQCFLLRQEKVTNDDCIDISLYGEQNAKKIKNYIKYLKIAAYCNTLCDKKDEDGLVYGIKKKIYGGFKVVVQCKPLAVFNSAESAQMGIRMLGNEFLSDFLLFP